MNSTPDEATGGCGSEGHLGERQDGRWHVEEQLEEDVVEDSYEYEEFASDNPYIYKQEELEVGDEDEPTALDLRTMRESGELDCLKLPKWNSIFNKFKGGIAIYREIDNIYYEPILNDGLQQKMTFNNPNFYYKSDFFMYDNASVVNSLTATDYSTGGLGNDYECEKVCWNYSTNSEPIKMADKATQTECKESYDATAQTESYPGLTGFLTFSKTPVNKYACSLCNRLYSAKSSYERHLRSHRSASGAKSVTYVRFTTEAKLQVYKQQPLIIQVPQPVESQHECTACKRVFGTTLERDCHHCIPELPMTKCPQCPTRFYTSGGLQDHINKAHKTSSDNSYYCVFCGESFDTGYSFHLHLDRHLSP